MTSLFLESLETVGGRLNVLDNGNGGANNYQDAFRSGSMDSLKTVSGSLRFRFNIGLTLLVLDALKTVGGKLEVVGHYWDLRSVSMNALETVDGDIIFAHNNGMNTLSMDALTTVGGSIRHEDKTNLLSCTTTHTSLCEKCWPNRPSGAVVQLFTDAAKVFPGTAKLGMTNPADQNSRVDSGVEGIDYVAATPSEDVGGIDGLTIAVWVKRPENVARSDGLPDQTIHGQDGGIVDFFSSGNEVLHYGPDGACTGYQWCNIKNQWIDCSGCHWSLPISNLLSFKYAGESDNSNVELKYSVGGAELYVSSEFPPDTWTHLAVVHDGGIANIYINGELQVLGTVNRPPNLARNNYLVGKFHGKNISPPRHYFTGEMRDLLVFNRPLDRNELAALWGTSCVPGDVWPFS